MIPGRRYGSFRSRHGALKSFAPAKLEVLLKDWQACAALERFIEILGEAVKRLPAELTSRYPEVPWKEIAGTRDHLSHGYDDVDYQVLWDAVQTDIPLLLATVEHILNDLSGGGGSA